MWRGPSPSFSCVTEGTTCHDQRGQYIASNISTLCGRVHKLIPDHFPNASHHIKSVQNPSKRDVLAVVVVRGHLHVEHELRSVGARREDAWTVVLPDAVLLGELLAVDGLASKSVTVSDVPTEPNMIWDYAVDDGSFVVERHAGLPYAFLAGTDHKS